MLRRSTVARQPARRSLAVHASQPGPHLHPPAAVSDAWVASQRAWVNVALNKPVELSGTNANGVEWSSRVHVLGVAHDSAANAWSVHEVAGAVKPDAVGHESDSSDTRLRCSITKVARSAPMVKLVNRLMDTPIESYEQAHGQLTIEERQGWAEGLLLAGLEIRSGFASHHQLGRPAYSDVIAAAFIARKRRAAFAFIDSPEGRHMYNQYMIKQQGKEDKSESGCVCDSANRRWIEEAVGESVSASFRLWEESDVGSELLHSAVYVAMAEAVTPEAVPITLNADPKEEREINAQRERGMHGNIVDLCRGELTGKPRKRVLAIVGRDHVAPLIELLKAE